MKNRCGGRLTKSPAAANRACEVHVDSLCEQGAKDLCVVKVDHPSCRRIGGRRSRGPVLARRWPQGRIDARPCHAVRERRKNYAAQFSDGRNSPIAMLRKTGCPGSVIGRHQVVEPLQEIAVQRSIGHLEFVLKDRSSTRAGPAHAVCPSRRWPQSIAELLGAVLLP